MNRLFREIRTLPGVVLSTTIALVVVFFVWNFLSQRNWPIVSPVSAWLGSHANGSAYGSSAAPAASTAAVSYVGPGF